MDRSVRPTEVNRSGSLALIRRVQRYSELGKPLIEHATPHRYDSGRVDIKHFTPARVQRDTQSRCSLQTKVECLASIKKIAICTGGGDAPGLNAVIHGAVYAA